MQGTDTLSHFSGSVQCSPTGLQRNLEYAGLLYEIQLAQQKEECIQPCIITEGIEIMLRLLHTGDIEGDNYEIASRGQQMANSTTCCVN